MKKLFVLQCTGKVCKIPSGNLSKTAVNVKLIKDRNISTGNSLISLSSQTLGKYYVLYVELIGPYTLEGKDGTSIDFMCLTMIDPASSWFEIVELPVTTDVVIHMDTKGHRGKQTHKQPKGAYFDKL